jgi:hypothetical protein
MYMKVEKQRSLSSRKESYSIEFFKALEVLNESNHVISILRNNDKKLPSSISTESWEYYPNGVDENDTIVKQKGFFKKFLHFLNFLRF